MDPDTRFEVVSIKPINDANTPMRTMTTPAGFESSLPVGGILRQALQKPDYQMVGAPGWINTERYSIRAKPPAGVPITAMSVMMLNMLKDRFQLVTHLETREQAIFHLVLARNDARLGPNLKPTSAECQATMANRQEAGRPASAVRRRSSIPATRAALAATLPAFSPSAVVPWPSSSRHYRTSPAVPWSTRRD